jgi:hypothetical protein
LLDREILVRSRKGIFCQLFLCFIKDDSKLMENIATDPVPIITLPPSPKRKRSDEEDRWNAKKPRHTILETKMKDTTKTDVLNLRGLKEKKYIQWIDWIKFLCRMNGIII